MKRLRILVVEDEPMIALLLGEILTSMGHEVCAIENAQAPAIAAALRCAPDLIIADERIRDGSGLAVVDAVLAVRPVPRIFVSGDAAGIRRRRPAAVVLEKPYFDTDLALAIQAAMAPEAWGPAPETGRSISLGVAARSEGVHLSEGL